MPISIPAPELTLEAFSTNPEIAEAQAYRAHELVAANEAALGESRPATLVRFATLDAARESMGHSAVEVKRFIINLRDLTTAGLATVIHGQQINHPPTGTSLSGDNVDYWLDNRLLESTKIHDLAVRELILKSWELWHVRYRSTEPATDHSMFATVLDRDHVHYNRWAESNNRMHLVGDGPTELTTDILGDPHGIARGGQPSWLYVGTKEDLMTLNDFKKRDTRLY